MRSFTLTPQWQMYDVDWTSRSDVPAGWAQVGVQLGTKLGDIDVAGVSLISSTAAK
jgi:hypothetical protein